MKRLLLAAVVLAALCASADAQVSAPAPYRNVALSNVAATIKSTRGTIQWGTCYNPSNAVALVNLYDTSSAVVVGTTTPKLSIGIASGANSPIMGPAQFLNAIKIAATTGDGSTAPSSNLICNFGFN